MTIMINFPSGLWIEPCRLAASFMKLGAEFLNLKRKIHQGVVPLIYEGQNKGSICSLLPLFSEIWPLVQTI